MTTFKAALENKIQNSVYNNFGIENYDELRYGDFKTKTKSFKDQLKYTVKKLLNYKSTEIAKEQLEKIEPYEDRLEFVWERISNESKKLMVDLIAFRILGYKKVWLPINNKNYWDSLAKAKTLKKDDKTIDSHFMHFMLEHFDLKPLGYDIEMYFSEVAVAIDFIIEQYAYKINDKYVVQVENGDYVLDIGGCWGDTALYFASKVGTNGKVFSFEFIPGNIKLHKMNTGLNPNLNGVIQLVEHPVSDVSGQTIYFKDNGPGSKIADKPFDEQTGSTTTISIDDFVKQNNISKIDFIKMDIEGAEPYALKGAVETIKKFRPKLAIAIYHSWDDFVNIPKWLMDLNLDYDFYIGHYTIHVEETILFAKPKNR